jgi:hypothetical protein
LFHYLFEGREHNFDIFDDGQFVGTSYDMDSVMQYDEYSFSKNGKATMEILGKNPNAVLTDSQRERFGLLVSKSDITALRKFYQCPKGTTSNPNPKRPKTSNLPVYSFTLTNNLAVSVQVFYVHFSEEILFYIIEPKQSITQSATYRENKWIVRGTDFEKTFFIGEGQFVKKDTNMKLSALV